jgi:pyruvate/2-oxoglutarate dehydrogenase complex dihydrolipoamide dehydrogenase (E3) component
MESNTFSYDLVVIGGGSAGLTAADFAVKLGVRVAILEKHKIGGDCTWTGCIPSKTLLSVAKTAHQARQASKYGLRLSEPEIDFSTVMAHVKHIVDGIYEEESPQVLRARGIDVHLGNFQFRDPHTLVNGEIEIRSKKIIIATGARLHLPQIEGLADLDTLSYENVWDLDQRPESLLILGAGMVGVELGQAFQRLGSQVKLVEAKPQILPQIDEQWATELSENLSSEGMQIYRDTPITEIWRDAAGYHLQSGEKRISGDALLVATGRRPNVQGLNLENAGVDFDENGIRVDKNLRTNQKHIFAAGDCTGGAQFTHLAGWQAFIATRNALLPGNSTGSVQHYPWVLFTDPELAQVGLSKSEADAKYASAARTTDWPFSKNDRAHTEDNPGGQLQIIHHKNGKILGATIMGKNAGELINEWALAISNQMRISDMAYALHAYPTYGLANMQLAAEIQSRSTLEGIAGKILRALAG